jgi:hypothetical protein
VLPGGGAGLGLLPGGACDRAGAGAGEGGLGLVLAAGQGGGAQQVPDVRRRPGERPLVPGPDGVQVAVAGGGQAAGVGAERGRGGVPGSRNPRVAAIEGAATRGCG